MTENIVLNTKIKCVKLGYQISPKEENEILTIPIDIIQQEVIRNQPYYRKKERMRQKINIKHLQNVTLNIYKGALYSNEKFIESIDELAEINFSPRILVIQNRMKCFINVKQQSKIFTLYPALVVTMITYQRNMIMTFNYKFASQESKNNLHPKLMNKTELDMLLKRFMSLKTFDTKQNQLEETEAENIDNIELYDNQLQPLLEQLNMLHNNPPKLDEKDKLNDQQRAVKEVEEHIKAINVAKDNQIIEMIIEMKNKCQNIDKERSGTLITEIDQVHPDIINKEIKYYESMLTNMSDDLSLISERNSELNSSSVPNSCRIISPVEDCSMHSIGSQESIISGFPDNNSEHQELNRNSNELNDVSIVHNQEGENAQQLDENLVSVQSDTHESEEENSNGNHSNTANVHDEREINTNNYSNLYAPNIQENNNILNSQTVNNDEQENNNILNLHTDYTVQHTLIKSNKRMQIKMEECITCKPITCYNSNCRIN